MAKAFRSTRVLTPDGFAPRHGDGPARVLLAMLFLRSPGGVSHYPDETMRQEDVEISLRVVQKFVERLATEFR